MTQRTSAPTKHRHPLGGKPLSMQLTPHRIAKLKSAYASFSSTNDMLRLIDFWTDCHHEEAQTMMQACFKSAESAATSVLDWVNLAGRYEAAAMHFHESLFGRSLDCMHQAESMCETSEDWLLCACSWTCSQMGDKTNDREAVQALRMAVLKAKTSQDFADIAYECGTLFFHNQGTTAMLRQAEALIETEEDQDYFDSVRDDLECDSEITEDRIPDLPFEIVEGRVEYKPLTSQM